MPDAPAGKATDPRPAGKRGPGRPPKGALRSDLPAVSMTHSERLAFARQSYRSTFYAFVGHCLAYDRVYEPHREWCASAQSFLEGYERRAGDPGYTKRVMRLMPRGTFKSTIFTVSFALWALVRDPNLRILIYSGKEGNAKNFLREIKKHITMNERFRACFGRWDEGADRWTETDIIIGPRTEARKEPSIAAIGKGTEITSMHFDIALVDDLVTRDDRDSAAARDLSRRSLQDLESIMEPESIVSLVGTHWHFDDAYKWIREDLNRELAAEGKRPWEIHVETVYESDGVTERFARIIPDLDDLKIKRGLVDFYANYMNNPLPPDTQLFHADRLALFDYDTDAYRGVPRYAYWDPASTERGAGRDPDYHAIIVVAAHSGGTYDVIDAWMKQGKPSEGYERAADMARGLGITHLRVELNHLPDADERLEAMFRELGIASAVSGQKATGSKISRIQALEPLVASGRIRFRRDWREASNGYRLLIEQLSMFPVAAHDDGPDALEGAYRLAVAGASPAYEYPGQRINVAPADYPGGLDASLSELIEYL